MCPATSTFISILHGTRLMEGGAALSSSHSPFTCQVLSSRASQARGRPRIVPSGVTTLTPTLTSDFLRKPALTSSVMTCPWYEFLWCPALLLIYAFAQFYHERCLVYHLSPCENLIFKRAIDMCVLLSGISPIFNRVHLSLLNKWWMYVCIQRHHLADKSPYTQSYDFSSSHVWMWELDPKEGWELKNWYFRTVLEKFWRSFEVLEKTLESPLDCKEIKPVNPKGNQPWIVIGRTDAEAEAPILWPPNEKSQLIEKDLDAGKDWRLCFINKDKQKLLAVLLIEISVWKWNLGHLFCCILLWKEHLFWFFKLFFSKDNAYIWQKGRH